MNKFLNSNSIKAHLIPHILSSFFLLIVFSITASGQGTLKGTVIAGDDGSPLISATVVVKGTTTGVITDYNGKYVLALNPDTYTIQFSYIGFENKEVTVIIEDKKITTLDISIDPISVMGKEVVVSVQARGQMAAVNQQIRSNQIVNVVSEERIRELPDENAAQAISRLPGIYLDGSKVVIRGIESKMNKIMINGVEMPSTDAQDRSTDLGMISANMLSGIEVYKTLTPDMDADAIGGIVNLRLREAPKGLHYSASIMGTYNQQEKFLGKSQIWCDIGNRFFDNRLGIVINFNYSKFKESKDWFTTAFVEHESGTIGTGIYMLNTLNVYDDLDLSDRTGGSMVIDFDLHRGKIIYSGLLNHTSSDNTEHHDYMNVGASYHEIHLTRSKSKSFFLNNSLSYEQQIGIVNLNASVSNVANYSNDEFKYRVRFNNIAPVRFIDTMITFPKRMAMESWEVYATLHPDASEAYRIRDCQMTPSVYNENQWLADLNVKIPLRFSDYINVDFKIGGKYRKKIRSFDRNSLVYNSTNIEKVNASIQPWLTSKGHPPNIGALYFKNFRDYDNKTNEGFMNNSPYYNMDYMISAELMDEMFLNQIDLTNPNLMVPGYASLNGDYWGWESLTAGYLMGEFNLGKRIVLIPGVRYEQTHNEYTSLKVEHGTSNYSIVRDTITRPTTSGHWLPHLHLRIRATDWWDIRFSYNNTLTRPDYSFLIPRIWYHTINGDGEAGNPFIRPAQSENIDANFSFYTRKMGLITIGVFQKTLKEIFYIQPTILKNLPDTIILAEFPFKKYPSLEQGVTDFPVNSPYKAFVKGLEAEWQSNFTWLPFPFNGLVLNANYTHVWSETKYMQHRMKTIKVPGSIFPVQIESDTFFVNRLINQANDIANISVGYDYKGFSARGSFQFQGNVISSIGIRPETNGYTNNIYKFDLVIKQRIPLKFADLDIFFNAINFTNVPKMTYSIFPNKGETNTSTRYTGQQFQLGIRLTH